MKTGTVRPMIQVMAKSSMTRKTSASRSPICRARVAAGSGSFPTMIEMKMMLSMPSTISITERVTKAAQASGLVSSSSILGSNS